MEFQMMVESAVAQLNCDAACVSTCTAAALTIDAKAKCLDTCMCYATPAVVAQATPVAAPVVTPAAPATPVTPVAPVAPAAPATPVVAAPVEAAPVAAADAAAATPVVVNAEPSANSASA
jgi:hypothetical protein